MSFCCICGEQGKVRHGLNICDKHYNQISFFTQETVQKKVDTYGVAYEDMVNQRLEELEKKYIMSKLKLLDIKEKLHKFI